MSAQLRNVLREFRRRRVEAGGGGAQANTSGRKPHLGLLQSFVDHGNKASVQDAADFLQELRFARDMQFKAGSIRGSHDDWRAECAVHPGWPIVRARLFQRGEAGPDALNDETLTRSWSLLHVLGFHDEATKMWPTIWKRVRVGRMTGFRQLISVWVHAPVENLAALDPIIAEAMGTGIQSTGLLLACLARAPEAPENSLVVARCANKLGAMLDVLETADLVGAVVHLDARADASQIQEVAQKARGAVVRRASVMNVKFEVVDLFRLLGVMKSTEDVLWAPVIEQLLSSAIPIAKAAEVCRALARISGGAESDLGKDLRRHVITQMRAVLRDSSDPLAVSVSADCIELFKEDYQTCAKFLIAANRMTKATFPVVLWKVFTSVASADVFTHHPQLGRKHLQDIAAVLEKNGVGPRMALESMPGYAKAMRINGTPLPSCAARMAERFVSTWGTLAEAGAEADVVKEARQHMLEFWVELCRLQVVDNAQKLTEVVTAVCADPDQLADVNIEALARLVDGLHSVQDADEVARECLQQVARALSVKMAKLPPSGLLGLARAAEGGQLRGMVTTEVQRRFEQRPSHLQVVKLRQGGEFDTLVGLLSIWTQWAAEGSGGCPPDEFCAFAEALVTQGLPDLMKAEPAAASGRLRSALLSASRRGPAAEEGGACLASLRRGVWLQLGASGQPVDDVGLACDVAHAYCALEGGRVTFDAAVGLWRLIAGSVDATAAAGDLKTSGEAIAVAATQAGRAAELQSFCLCVSRLAAAPARATIQMMPEAVALDACLNHLSRKRQTESDQADGDVEAARELRAELRQVVSLQERVEGPFQIPGTPFSADAALPGRKHLFVVQRPRDSAAGPTGEVEAGGGVRVTGSALLQESLLRAMGWSFTWVPSAAPGEAIAAGLATSSPSVVAAK